MKTIFAGPLTLALAASLSALLVWPVRADSLDELYAKAQSEGALTIYGGGPARIYEDWIKQYETRFPGIKVTLIGGYAGGLAPMIDKQIAANRLEVDFVTFQAVQEFFRWKAEGVLLPFKMYRSPFFTAVVLAALASEPEPGSVRAHAPSHSPLASSGM